jgi:UDP-glucose 4-epimerase
LADALLARGDGVVVLDDLSTGRPDNIAHLRSHAAFQFVQGSILDERVVDALAGACDEVYHLAAAVGVKLIVDDPVHTIQTNVTGTEVVLAAAERHGRKTFIASTSEVYGKDARPGGGRFKESDDLTFGASLRWCYGCSKALDEYFARALWKQRRLPVVIGRFFNTVGPRQTSAYGMVVPRFIQQALAAQPITVYGDGRQVRTFGWVGDVVRAVVALMRDPATAGETFNIGGDEAVTVEELAERVRRRTGSSSEIVHVPYEEAYGSGFEDAEYRVPDITKLRAKIGYRPTKTLDAILDAVIASYRARRTDP